MRLLRSSPSYFFLGICLSDIFVLATNRTFTYYNENLTHSGYFVGFIYFSILRLLKWDYFEGNEIYSIVFVFLGLHVILGCKIYRKYNLTVKGIKVYYESK